MTTKKATTDDLRVLIAELSGKVSKVDQDYSDLRSTVVALSHHIDNAVESINLKIDASLKPQWQTYIAGAGFLIVLLGAFWAAGITPIKDTLALHAVSVNRSDDLIRMNDAASRERLHALDDQIAATLERRNQIYLPRLEHEEFGKRIANDLDKVISRLQFIEQTRPTTGELQAIGNNAQKNIDKIEERVRAIESIAHK